MALKKRKTAVNIIILKNHPNHQRFIVNNIVL